MSGGLQLASASAENTLLSCLINLRMAPSIALSMGLTREDYAWEVNALMHDAIMRVFERGEAVDKTVLTAELQSSNHLTLVGGEDVITRIASSPSDAQMLPSYVNIVRDRSMRRRIMGGFEKSTQILLSEPDGKVAIERVQEEMFRSFDKYLQSAFNGISTASLRDIWELSQGQDSYIPYPFEEMNHRAGGRQLGTLNIWGGYSSDGKSTIALASVVCAAVAGHRVGFVCLEMTEEQMTTRLLSMMTGLSTEQLAGSLSIDDQKLIDAAFDTIEKWDLTLYCDPSITVSDLRNIQMKERYDYICIDYLQRFDFADFHQVPRMAKQIKNLAIQTRCAIDLLSQLTPKEIQAGQNPFTRPDNHSLYGGKATANEADNIFFIWAERMNEGSGWVRTGEGLLMCTKLRQGAAEWGIPMKFNRQRVVWEAA